MTNTLNIPIKLMKRYRLDKAKWELFVFAVCIKQLYGSSAFKPSVALVRKKLNCSYYKAARLIERAKEDQELFVYYPEANLLIARSFTRGKLKKSENRSGRRTFVAYSAFCYKYRYDNAETISHNAISRLLKDRLLIHAIKARQLKNDLQTVVKNLSTHSRSNRSTALHCKRLGNMIGCHYTTALRHLRSMEKADKLSVYRPEYLPVVDRRSGTILTDNTDLIKRKLFLRGDYLVTRDINEYILPTDNNDTFANVIFNHHGRRNRNLRCDRTVARKMSSAEFAERWFEFINR